tara:strand:- start:3058 stop:3291 length:234 start_codon:yes stop_codon:yes gene_type:complete
MSKSTHKTRMLQHLKDGNTITSKEAYEEFGNTRLSATIFSLRRDGHEIVGHPRQVPTRYGEMTIVTQYKLIKEKSNV